VPIEKIFSKDAVDEMCVKSGFDPFGTVMIAFVVVVVVSPLGHGRRLRLEILSF
jgi:hypothetical protein